MSRIGSSVCSVCHGTGQAALFTSLTQCPSCDGLGWWLADDYKDFFEELYETHPELLRAVAEFYLNKLKE
jgi:hypothetical protein